MEEAAADQNKKRVLKQILIKHLEKLGKIGSQACDEMMLMIIIIIIIQKVTTGIRK